jgi:hypothetical protein
MCPRETEAGASATHVTERLRRFCDESAGRRLSSYLPALAYNRCTSGAPDTMRAWVQVARNWLSYAGLWTSANCFEPFAPYLQGGGRWFKSSIAHF